MLEAIGLSELDEQVYLSLLNGAAEDDLAARSGASPAALRTSIDRLTQMRLVRRSPSTGYHEAVPPGMALPGLIASSAEAVRRSKQAADELLSGFLYGPGGDPVGVAEAFAADQAGDVLREILEYAADEVVLADVESPALPVAPESLARMEEPGVTLKIVCTGSPSWLPGPGSAAMVRTVPHVPVSFLIADGRHAAVALTDGSVALISEPALLTILAEVAAALWRGGIAVGGQGWLGPEDADLLRMLNAGMKDEAIARHSGLSVRTVKRQIAALFEVLGAETRFQAGTQARRQGLL